MYNKKIQFTLDGKPLFVTNARKTCKEAISKLKENIIKYPASYGWLQKGIDNGGKLKANFLK